LYYLILLLLVFTAAYVLLLSYLQGRITKFSRDKGGYTPSVTVVIAARNEERNLPALFASLASQTYPEALTEIILINDRSEDNTGPLMQQFSKTRTNVSCIEISCSDLQTSPKKYAIEQAIALAENEIILTTDADCTHSPNWIKSMMSCFSEDISMVLGYAPYLTTGRFNTLFHKLLAFDYLAMGTISLAGIASGYPVTSFGGNLAYRKAEFIKLGGFGEANRFISGDDDLLVHRFNNSARGRITFNNQADSAAFNPPPVNLKKFIRQRLRFSSKHLAYPAELLFGMGLVYIFNLLLIAGLIYSIFNPAAFILTAAMLALKTAVDLRLLKKGTTLLHERNFLHLYPLAMIPHLFYVVLIPLFAQIKPQRW